MPRCRGRHSRGAAHGQVPHSRCQLGHGSRPAGAADSGRRRRRHAVSGGDGVHGHPAGRHRRRRLRRAVHAARCGGGGRGGSGRGHDQVRRIPGRWPDHLGVGPTRVHLRGSDRRRHPRGNDQRRRHLSDLRRPDRRPRRAHRAEADPGCRGGWGRDPQRGTVERDRLPGRGQHQRRRSRRRRWRDQEHRERRAHRGQQHLPGEQLRLLRRWQPGWGRHQQRR